MYQDFYQYLQWLQNCISSQENRIIALEQTIKSLKDEIQKGNEKQCIHVDRIEYKFDQLKVETLEGTLNIGLNPNDLAGIEDFAVQNQTLKTPLSPDAQMQRSLKIEDAIYQYLESDLPQIIVDTQNKLSLPPNESYLSFIKEDILKQLPSRIDHHLKNRKLQDRSESDQAFDEQIITLLKQEIQNGVFIFLNNLPENVKGMKIE